LLNRAVQIYEAGPTAIFSWFFCRGFLIPSGHPQKGIGKRLKVKVKGSKGQVPGPTFVSNTGSAHICKSGAAFNTTNPVLRVGHLSSLRLLLLLLLLRCPHQCRSIIIPRLIVSRRRTTDILLLRVDRQVRRQDRYSPCSIVGRARGRRDIIAIHPALNRSASPRRSSHAEQVARTSYHDDDATPSVLHYRAAQRTAYQIRFLSVCVSVCRQDYSRNNVDGFGK